VDDTLSHDCNIAPPLNVPSLQRLVFLQTFMVFQEYNEATSAFPMFDCDDGVVYAWLAVMISEDDIQTGRATLGIALGMNISRNGVLG
jgi:hypothetical protein